MAMVIHPGLKREVLPLWPNSALDLVRVITTEIQNSCLASKCPVFYYSNAMHTFSGPHSLASSPGWCL